MNDTHGIAVWSKKTFKKSILFLLKAKYCSKKTGYVQITKYKMLHYWMRELRRAVKISVKLSSQLAEFGAFSERVWILPF
jgi:hypothetical protein